MNVRLLATVAAAVAAAAAVAPAADAAPKKPKQVKETYAVSAPLPYPMLETIPTGHGCWQGQESLHKHTKRITLPATGSLQVSVAYNGDWDLYLFDAGNNMIGMSETDDMGNNGTAPGTEKLTYKKGKKAQQLSIVACNWAGQKDASVTYVFTYAK